MDTFYQMKHDDARRTARRLRAQGEYIWADHWEKFARSIVGADNEYKEACRKAAFQRQATKKQVADPLPSMPLQPANLTSNQCTYRPLYRRPAQLQSIRI